MYNKYIHWKICHLYSPGLRYRDKDREKARVLVMVLEAHNEFLRLPGYNATETLKL